MVVAAAVVGAAVVVAVDAIVVVALPDNPVWFVVDADVVVALPDNPFWFVVDADVVVALPDNPFWFVVFVVWLDWLKNLRYVSTRRRPFISLHDLSLSFHKHIVVNLLQLDLVCKYVHDKTVRLTG